MLEYLLTALLIGFLISIPVGPIAVLCIKYTFEYRLVGAICVAIGAAFADTLYSSIAAFGLYSISQFLVSHVSAIKLICGVCLIYLGINQMRDKKDSNVYTSAKSRWNLIGKSFFVTLLNPLNALAFMGIFALVDLVPTNITNMLMTVLGVFLGAFSWWIILGAIILQFRARFSEKFIQLLGKQSGSVLIALGVFGIIHSILVFFKWALVSAS